MKNNLRRLNAIMKLFPDNAFYTVSCDTGGVSLQGRHSSMVSRQCKKLKFQCTYDADQGWAEFSRSYYRITLTA